MNIRFQSNKLEQECNEFRLLQKRHGVQRAKLINRRLGALKAANCLQDLWNAPGRCHELLHDRAGQFSLDLDGPYRLIFQPAANPIPRKDDSSIDWTQISDVVILGVEDTHE